MTGRLVGVGVGPGDPELVTVKALRILEESGRVFAPTVAVDAPGRAESIVREALPGARMERVVFEMSPAGLTRQQASARSNGEAARRVLPWLDRGEQVAFVTLGDPAVYSTFSSLSAAVTAMRPGVAVSTVPGIMAFQALAARARAVLVDATESLSLVTALDSAEQVEEVLDHPERAVVVYKGGRHLPAIASALESAGRLDGAVVGELIGLPGERVAPLAKVRDAPATYLATVVVPPWERRA